MSSELFERYRDALRIGHVAAARGDLVAAAWAYREAIGLVPDRPVAHVGLGGIHLQTGDVAEALAEYDLALARTPRDEAALDGRAEALARLGRRIDAAETLDRLSAVHESAGRLPEALDAATRAVALAEGPARRRRIDRLGARLAPAAEPVSEAGPPSEVLLRDRPAVEPQGTAAPEPPASHAPGPGFETAPDDATAAALDVEPAADPLTAARVDGLERMAVAEDALDRGDREVARLAALMAAEAFRVDGRSSAAIDACAFALAIAPGDPALHLELVTLYLERGWRARAEEKLVLLGRLSELDGDGATRLQLCSVAAVEFPENPELAALCGAA
jgi:tetratricopeptide (TPR) repeat protein